MPSFMIVSNTIFIMFCTDCVWMTKTNIWNITPYATCHVLCCGDRKWQNMLQSTFLGPFQKYNRHIFRLWQFSPVGLLLFTNSDHQSRVFSKVREVTTQWYLQRTFTWIPFLISTTPSDFIIDTSSKWAIQYNESISTYIWLEKYSVVHLKETIYRWQTFTICTVYSTTSAASFLISCIAM